MFQPNTLSRLYPHLNFGRIPPPSANILQSTIPARSSSVHSNKSVTFETKTPEVVKTQTVEPPVEVVKAPDISKDETTAKPVVVTEEKPIKVKRIKWVKIEEPAPAVLKCEAPVEPEVIKCEAPQPKRTRPNRAKVLPKPEPERDSVIPVKGEQGLQSKYSLEQRKQIYLTRLSRKSIINAEKEIAKVNEVLEGVDHDVDKLKRVEKEIKGKLKLINYAKYFTQTAGNVNCGSTLNNAKPLNINETPKTTTKTPPPTSGKFLNPIPVAGDGRGRSGIDPEGSSGDSASDSDSTESSVE